MSTGLRYRLIQFVPDPFLPSEIAVGALLASDDKVTVVKATHVPGPACLGGDDRYALLVAALRELAGHANFERLPHSMGSHFKLSKQAFDVPSRVPDPEAWLSRMFHGEPVTSARPKGPRRSTEGYRFFERYGVAPLVQKGFDPAGSELFSASGNYGMLEKISHYAASSNRVILMEPLIVHRQNWQTDARHVFTRFAAYDRARQQGASTGVKIDLIGYVLSGQASAVRKEAMHALHNAADWVVDVDDAPARNWLLQEIRSTANVNLVH